MPTLLACLGGALIWRQASGPDRGPAALRVSRDSLGAPRADRTGPAAPGRGAALVVAGAVLVLAPGGLHRDPRRAARDGRHRVGLALVTGPWWMRLAVAAGRRARRADPDPGARRHRRAPARLGAADARADPAQRRLAARGRPAGARAGARAAHPALRRRARPPASSATSCARPPAEVEDAYAVTVDVVVVGDAALDDALAAVVRRGARGDGQRGQALRRRRRCRCTPRSRPTRCSVFVKDRGVGFDPDDVADDRQGVRGVDHRPGGAPRRHGRDRAQPARRAAPRSSDAEDAAPMTPVGAGRRPRDVPRRRAGRTRRPGRRRRRGGRPGRPPSR